MARYSTRIRPRTPVIEVEGLDGSVTLARVKAVQGMSLTLVPRDGEAGFGAGLEEGVKEIRFANSARTAERLAQRALLYKVRWVVLWTTLAPQRWRGLCRRL